ncbi:MAG: hypothetical protein HKL88_04750 [Bacteroidia bacterium]|nr:hypothetical protein [Bacteroidia bacterium]
MEANTNEPLKALKDQIMEYVDLKTEYLRLTAMEYVAKTTSFVFTTVVQVFILFMFVLFLAISLAFFAGSYFHSFGLGFLFSSGLFLLWLICFSIFGKKRMRNFIARKIISMNDKN